MCCDVIYQISDEKRYKSPRCHLLHRPYTCRFRPKRHVTQVTTLHAERVGVCMHVYVCDVCTNACIVVQAAGEAEVEHLFKLSKEIVRFGE